MAAWLTALMLVPLAAIGYQLAVTGAQRSATARESAEVEARSAHLIQVVNLGVAVVKERMPTTLVLAGAGAGATGLSAEQAAQAMGGHLNTDLGTSRAATDRALAALSDPWTGDVRADLYAAREAVDDPAERAGGEGLRAIARVLHAQDAIDQQVLTGIAELQRRADVVAGTSAIEQRLREDLLAVQASFQLMTSFADEGAAAFALGGIDTGAAVNSSAFPAPITSPRIVMVVANAGYQATVRQLQQVASPAVAATLAKVQQNPGSRVVTQYFASLSAGLGAQAADGDRLRPDFANTAFWSRIFLSAGVSHLGLLNDVVTAAGAQVADDARTARAQADTAFRQILLTALGIVIFALLGVALLSRGVTRPLADVAARARQISGGTLAPSSSPASPGSVPRPPTGPREVAAVSEAFDVMVENLQLLQAQAAALAAGDTADPSLQQTVPGALGDALRASVGRLSASLEARKELESQLRHESTHDGLTGLLNRPAALVALESGLARVNRAAGGLGVIQIDLDRLQAINDAAGPSAGDEVLRAAAVALSGAIRTGDVVARLGSDEFVVVAETTSVDVLMDLSQRIIDRLAAVPLADLLGPSLRLRDAGLPDGIGATAGVVVAFDGVHDATSILRDAASAVRAAKRRGGGQIELLDDELRRALDRRNKVSDGLREALDAGDLVLHYQPIVDMNGATAGVEALARWTSAELGVVTPDVFVEAAEASELVLELDRWVLKESLRQLGAWDDAGQLPGIYLSVNISGRHLGERQLVGDVTSALRRSGIAPSRLLLEITETVLLSDLSVAAGELSELRALGIRVAVDDFGTGYTSVSHLQQLPVDILKIDRSFIVGMSDERGRVIVRMMVEMASALGLSVVAEGVETPAELEALREMGCPLVQGYLLGRPAEAAVAAAQGAESGMSVLSW